VSLKSVLEECPWRVSLKSVLEECPWRVSLKSVLDNVLEECPWQCPWRVSLTMSLKKTIGWRVFTLIYSPTETPHPRPQLYTLIQVPYYGSLLSVYIGIEKWVINWVMGYILGNGCALHPRPLLYTPTWFLNVYPSPETPTPETLTIYHLAGPYCESLTSVYISIKKSVINWVIGYILGNGCSLLTRPYHIPSTRFLNVFTSHETLTIYPQHGSLMYSLLTRPLPYTLNMVP